MAKKSSPATSEKKIPRKRGRKPKHRPTDAYRKLVQKGAANGLTMAQCGVLLGGEDGPPVPRKDVEKLYKQQWDYGRALLAQQIGGTVMYRAQTDRSAGAAIFAAKAILGWKEATEEKSAQQSNVTVVIKTVDTGGAAKIKSNI